MASLGIDGLASGLQTTDIINQLMKIEAGPQTLLKSKQSSAQNVVTALQGINSRLAALSDAAAEAAKASNWTSFKATSSVSSVTAAAGTDAVEGSITFSVDQVAKKQVSLSAIAADGAALGAANPPTLSVKKSDGSIVTVTAASNSLEDMAAAINDSGTGVSATAVRVTGGDTPTYRLQFTGTATGTDGSFAVYLGDEAAVTAETAPRLDASVATAASNAQITLWKGTAYEQVLTQSSNTFDDLLTGVSVTVSAPTASGETATVSVAPDASGVKDLAKTLVGTLQTVFSDITSRTATVTGTNADGTTKVTGGILTGDLGMQQLRSALVEAATYPVGGASPSTVGVILKRDGTVSFDEAAFAKALADDPDGTAAFIQTLATRVQDTADAYSDPYDGTLTLRITGQQSLVKDYTSQIEDWDRRLELRRTALQTTYSALEVTLSNLNSQSTWLAGQLSSLTSSTSS